MLTFLFLSSFKISPTKGPLEMPMVMVSLILLLFDAYEVQKVLLPSYSGLN